MAYNLVYKKSVYRDLKKLGNHQAKRVMRRIKQELPDQADKNPVLKGEFTGLRKFRIGDYRVVYAIVENNVIILRIRHRKDVYQ